jgi:hypothetical protein
MTVAKRELLDVRQLYSGLIRLHILHHAAKEGIFGLGMIEELARHGYKLSPGTLYPVLHGLEKNGLLCSFKNKARKHRAASLADIRYLKGEAALTSSPNHFHPESPETLSTLTSHFRPLRPARPRRR